MDISEPGQNREIAALRINVHVHHLFWSDIFIMDDYKYMKKALDEAYKAYNMDEIPVGATIVFNNQIIAKAHNLKDSSGIVTRHAELIAIEIANKKIGDWRLDNAVMYITLEPCPMCAGAIIQSRIKKVYFGVSDEKTGAVGSKLNLFKDFKFNHNVGFEKSILEQECQNLLQNFFKELRVKKLEERSDKNE